MTELELIDRNGEQVYRGQVRWPDGKLSNADATWHPEWIRVGTTREIEMLRHALGVQRRGGKWTEPFRNHFVAGEADVATWEALVASGHARLSHKGGSLSDGMPVYVVTEAGKIVALAGLIDTPEGAV